jgi:hypothetical protein
MFESQQSQMQTIWLAGTTGRASEPGPAEAGRESLRARLGRLLAAVRRRHRTVHAAPLCRPQQVCC